MNGGEEDCVWVVSVKARWKEATRKTKTWVDSIRMDLVEVGWGDVDWIGLAQDRDRWTALVNSVLNLHVSLKFWETIECPNNWGSLE
jgi:hypothetical protein